MTDGPRALLHQRITALQNGGVVDPARLDELIIQIVHAEGLEPPPGTEHFFKDFLHALMASPVSINFSDPDKQQIVAERLAKQLDLPLSIVATIVQLVLAPQFRLHHSRDELAAYAARFGPEAAKYLQDAEQQLDLTGFAQRYGSEDALYLLDTLLVLSRHEGSIDSGVLASLQTTANELGFPGDAGLVPGRYYWHVAAVSPEGRRLPSELVAITVTGTRRPGR